MRTDTMEAWNFALRISNFRPNTPYVSCRMYLAVAVVTLMVLGQISWSAPADDNEPSQQIYEQTAGSFVVVSYHLKKSGSSERRLL